ncbi:hypothetical protein V6N11_056915 [Hibiscus sabdariffa]|uniref:Uncharacterized protein n=1 Tax=Hibiscus sabdariffa TaxID=183260 RepID=A0ABR2T5L0_9ROSI
MSVLCSSLGGVGSWNNSILEYCQCICHVCWNKQLMLWGQLVDFLAASSLSAYCVGGKCNVVRWESERIGCSTAVSGMDEFSTFCGKHFTWFGSGNRCNRLDRFLVSPLWMIFL